MERDLSDCARVKKDRSLHRLSDRKIQNAKPSRGRKVLMLHDGGGLYLQVKADDDGKIVSRSWIFRFATRERTISADGREYKTQRRMGLGPLHTVSLSEAREAARQARKLHYDHVDPIEQRKEGRVEAALAKAKTMTFDECADSISRRIELDGEISSMPRSGAQRSRHTRVRC